jgi:hypothetical protein
MNMKMGDPTELHMADNAEVAITVDSIVLIAHVITESSVILEAAEYG